MNSLALAAAGAAVAGLTACSHATVPSAVPASSSTVTSPSTVTSSPTVSHSAVPVNCRRQYDTWKQGPGKGLVAELSAVSSADTVGNTRVLTAVLKKAEPAVARAAATQCPPVRTRRGTGNLY
jgi:hypothetical protein